MRLSIALVALRGPGAGPSQSTWSDDLTPVCSQAIGAERLEGWHKLAQLSDHVLLRNSNFCPLVLLSSTRLVLPIFLRLTGNGLILETVVVETDSFPVTLPLLLSCQLGAACMDRTLCRRGLCVSSKGLLIGSSL